MIKLSEYKIRKNKINPDMCYSYERKEGNKKFTIFTMNGGITFLASYELKRIDNRYYTECSETVSYLKDAVSYLNDLTI